MDCFSVTSKEKVENYKVNQRLTSSLNQGDLRAIPESTQSVFERTEHYLRDVISDNNSQKNDATSIISRSVPDAEVVSPYNSMLLDSELMINKGDAKDVFNFMLKFDHFLLQKTLSKDIR